MWIDLKIDNRNSKKFISVLNLKQVRAMDLRLKKMQKLNRRKMMRQVVALVEGLRDKWKRMRRKT